MSQNFLGAEPIGDLVLFASTNGRLVTRVELDRGRAAPFGIEATETSSVTRRPL
jgi:hypothetical protein